MGKISIDTPLAELQLRRYEKPNLNGRDLVRRVCLSLGLLQPGDSRDVIVDIMLVLLKARGKKEELHSEEIKNHVIDIRKSAQLPMLGIAASNIRRQLKRLKDLHLIETNANLYRISEFANLSELFDEKIEKFLLRSIVGRVKEYLKAVDTEFSID
jgi:DNA-binding transcriptional ArsR family regulator